MYSIFVVGFECNLTIPWRERIFYIFNITLLDIACSYLIKCLSTQERDQGTWVPFKRMLLIKYKFYTTFKGLCLLIILDDYIISVRLWFQKFDKNKRKQKEKTFQVIGVCHQCIDYIYFACCKKLLSWKFF